MGTSLKNSTRSVRIEPPNVVKQIIPDFCDIEAQRTRAARDVAKHSGTFIVPQVFELEAKIGLLVLEYLPELTHPLDRSIVLSDKRAAIFKNIGKAVAELHSGLDVSDAMTHGTRAGGGERHMNDVVLHGDCHPGHTLWSKAANKVAVIDWSGMYISGRSPTVRTYGPRRRDTVFWIVELVSQSLRTRSFVGFFRCPELIEYFVRGYEEGSGRDISRKRLRVQYMESMKERFKNVDAEHRAGLVASFNRTLRMLLMFVMGLLLFRWKQESGKTNSMLANRNNES